MRIFSVFFPVLFFIPTLAMGMQDDIDSGKTISLKRNLSDNQPVDIKSSPNGHLRKSQEQNKENEVPRLADVSQPDIKQEKKRKIKNSQETEEEKQPSPLFENVGGLQSQILLGRKEADPRTIYKAYLAFIELKSDEETWEAIAKSMKAYRWPSQKSWRQVVGGHLFFPEETLEWEALCEIYRMRRVDALWSFAFGAKFQHAMSKFYLIRVLDKLRSEYTDVDRPKFFEQLYTEAFIDLKQCKDNPDACYVIGRNYCSFPYLASYYLSGYKDRTDEALKWHARGKDLKNQYQILQLRIKKSRSARYAPPAQEDYLSLAQQGYGPAYVEASELTKTYDEKEKILKHAIDKGYKPALLWLGCLYHDRGKREEAKETCIKAGEAGVTQAYVILGKMHVGDIKYDKDSVKKLKERSPDDIQEAIKWFTRAGDAKNQEGWSYLSILYRKLAKQHLMSEEDYYEKNVRPLLKGMSLGSADCYRIAYYRFTKESFRNCLEVYGYPPYADLRFTIEKFINNHP